MNSGKASRGWSLLLSMVVLAAGCLPTGKQGGQVAVSGDNGGDGGVPGVDGGQTAVEPLPVVKWTGKYDEGWKQVSKLRSEQKYEAAAKLVGEILERARAEKRVEDWLKGLVRTVQLRSALHGYERAVRFFRQQPWPEDLLGQTTCELYYAELLVNYASRYRWEIQKRERVETGGEVDLKKWTLEQIYAEAGRAYGRLWGHREQLGKQKAKSLGEYLKLGNYPRDIRGSLRDVVTYHWVQLLMDRNGWRPEQKNEVYALDLDGLLGPAGKRPRGLRLADGGVHPLEKVAFLLKDLESWHLAGGRREAGLEARLVLLRHLYAAWTQKQDRQRIAEALRRRLEKEKDIAWWAVGRAQLAQWVMGHDEPEALVQARRIALDCQERFPKSIGGQRCRSIRQQIEQPAYQLEGMASDGPGKRSLLVRHKNLARVWFRAYRMDLRGMIAGADDYNIFPQWRRIKKLLAGKATASWSTELPATPDYRLHKTFVTPPLKEPGYYLVVASGREDFSGDNNFLTALNFILSDLVLVERQHGRQVEVTALSGASGEPLRGVEVDLYRYDWRSGHRAVATKTTGREGTVSFLRDDNKQYFLYARRGRQVALDPNYLYLYARRPVEKTTATLLYTDRSVYRPGQKLKFKAVLYSGRRSRADYHTLAGRKVRVWLQDANRKSVADATFTTNERGTVAGEFTIPAGRMLGQWQLRASPSGRALVRVEEYKRPTFEVKIIEAKKALRLNRRARLEGQARYYFGLPVNAGRVNWRVERTPLYPWWWGWWYGSAVAQSQVVATGTARLDEEGKFAVEFVPRADERLADTGISYNYRLSAEVTDEGGETRTAQRSFRLGFVAVEGRFVLEKGFLLAGRPEKVKVQRSNLDGAAAPGVGRWELYRLRQPAETKLPAAQPLPEPPGVQQDRGFATRGDRQRERWRPNYSAQAVLYGWADGKRLAGGRLTHDEKGQAEFQLPALRPGAYRLRYRTRDAFGKEFSTQRELVVAGEGLELKLPLYFAQELGTVKVGEQARFLVHSGLPDQVLVVEFWRDGKRTERRLLRAGRDRGLIELPVGEGDRGGYGITVFAVRDHQYLANQGSVMVPWDNHELKVSFATFRDRLRPGQRESWTVKVTGPAGKDSAVAGAEVLAYMYDRSLDIFAPHNPPSALSLFPSFMNTASLRASLYQARQSWVRSSGFPRPGKFPQLRRSRLALLSGYGIGGIGYGGGGRLLRKRGMALPTEAPRASRGDVVLDEVAQAGEKVTGRLAAAGSAPSKDKRMVLNGAAAGSPPAPAPAPVQLRQDFSETAFFQPQLVTGADGTVELRFEVPDSVTAWNVWVHAITRDLSSGSLKKEARSVKELMVRPYLPRFLREGDRAELKVVVQNAGESKLAGELQFDIIDPATERSLLDEFGLQPGRARRKFSVEPGGSSSEVFVVKAPVRVGQVAVRVVARAGAFSDGELRPLPLLPGRMHLMQSRFVTVKGGQLRRLHFADMERSDDPSRIDEQLVVTLDAQLFYSVLAAVPYLVNYPYECTEQLLNRFLSAGIMASLYARYPALERLGRKLGRRRTQYESFDRPDANRKLALEETPWLVESQGGGVPGKDLVKILVPEVARAHRLVTLAKLKKAQTSSGGFPWFPGGPPSPYMTLYLLYGFSKGLEFGVEVPKGMVKRAWRYEKRHYLDHLVRECLEEDLCWEEITFLNYVLSNYPDASWWGEMFSDAERQRMLDFSFKHWKEHAPLLKGYLALTLKRMGRGRDARLVWASVMDSAHSDPDTGTSWAPEDRGWLWYNDSIETHALAVRVEMEIDPRDEKLEGLVQWLFLNKKLNHWKSTKATAEVVYSLAHYLKKTGQLGRQQRARVKVGDLVKDYLFRPDEYTGKSNQLVIAPPRLDARKQATVEVENRSRGMMFASATWHFSTEKLPAEARGDLLQVRREYFRRVKTGREVVLRPLADGERIEVGDELEVHISLRAKHPAGYVHLRDPRPAGCEPVSLRSRHRWALGVYWYEEVRDSGTNFFFERLPQGEYPFKYRLRAAVAGTFKVAPATVQPMYAPEFAAYSAGNTISIQPAK